MIADERLLSAGAAVAVALQIDSIWPLVSSNERKSNGNLMKDTRIVCNYFCLQQMLTTRSIHNHNKY